MEKATVPELIAEKIVEFVGTFWYLVIQTSFIVAWILGNHIFGLGLDPFPYIFLTLLLSVQASTVGVLILIAARREEKLSKMINMRDLETDKATRQDTTRIREDLGHLHQLVIELHEKLDKQES